MNPFRGAVAHRGCGSAGGRRLRGWALALLLAAAHAFATPPPEAYREAFITFFPAYEMARLRYAALEDTAMPRRGRPNELNHARRLLDASARTVTTPNNDTLYSSARLDLRLGPVLVETPAVRERYYSLQFMNLHTDNLAILGRRVGGDGPLRVAVVGPGWDGPLPAHTHLVRSDTNDGWLLVRTLVDGPDDLAAVAALQDGMHIRSPKPASDYPPQRVKPPKDPDPAAFIAVVGEMLQRNPPQGAMALRADAAAELGIGIKSTWNDLPADVRDGWLRQWPGLNAELQNPVNLRMRTLAGWEVPPPELGQWGDNRLLRASVALRGIAALDLAEALYLSTFVDFAGRPLDGRQRYRLHIPPGGVPVRAFWSISMYEVLPDGRSYFTANPIGRYAVGDRTPGLKANADGSIDLAVQADAPADDTNWLPAPRGPFRLTLRAYLPQPALVRGEAPLPRIELR